MEYTIRELSRLSGATTRALRWYDKIGLLKPSGRTEGGYRLYGPEEVDRLQDILYYRALGVEAVWTTPPSTACPPCGATSPPWRGSGTGSNG